MAALPIFGRLLGTTKIPPKRGVCKALLKRIMRLSVSCAAFAGHNLTKGNRRRRPFHRRMERCACGSEHPLEHIDGRQSEHCVPRDDPRIDLNRSTELAGDVIHCPRSSRAFSVSLARTLVARRGFDKSCRVYLCIFTHLAPTCCHTSLDFLVICGKLPQFRMSLSWLNTCKVSVARIFVMRYDWSVRWS